MVNKKSSKGEARGIAQDSNTLKEQIKGFNEAYKIVKEKGFENYFCLNQTTWKEAYEKFKKGGILLEDTYILRLQENVNIVLNFEGKGLPYCKKCNKIFSGQEFKAGFKNCEHCAGDCGCKAVLPEVNN